MSSFIKWEEQWDRPHSRVLWRLSWCIPSVCQFLACSTGSKMAAFTSLNLKVFCWECLILCGMLHFLLFIFASSLAIYDCCLVSIANSQLGDNAPVASTLTLIPVPQDNNYVTLEVFGEIPSGWVNWVFSLDCYRIWSYVKPSREKSSHHSLSLFSSQER